MSTHGRALTIDDQLIMGAVEGLSAEEISRRLYGAVTPARVVKRTKQLLQATDWLTEREHERALLSTLRTRITQLQDANDLDSIKVQFTLVKEVLAQLDKRTNANDADINTYDANVGRQLGRVVDMALSYMKGAFRNEISAEAWDDAKEAALVLAAEEIAKKEKPEVGA